VSYALDKDEEPGAGLVRVIAEQADRLREACGSYGDPAPFVHKARVRCKRIRAALRLAKPLIGKKAYVRENAWWRDAARGLSHVRDMTARLEALAAFQDDLELEVGGSVVRRLRWQFERERRDYEGEALADDPIGEFCAQVSRHTLGVLSEIAECSDARLAHTLGSTFDKAREAMLAAYAKDVPAAYHEWRKQTKYHALQLRLVRNIFPQVEARIEAARDLANLLGGVQDVEVLSHGLAAGRNDHHIFGALKARKSVMLQGAKIAGEVLFASHRKAWSRSLDREHAAPDL
jgi:CHAD domain-containing protein